MVEGYFVEKEFGKTFYYKTADYTPFLCYDKVIEVGPNKDEVRFARILQTVAYVVVDEDEYGPITEKWYLKKNVPFAA